MAEHMFTDKLSASVAFGIELVKPNTAFVRAFSGSGIDEQTGAAGLRAQVCSRISKQRAAAFA